PVLQAVVLTVFVLHFGRPVLLPLAFAVLLTFLLKPVVGALERRGFRRSVAVSMIMLLIVVLLSAAGRQVGAQLIDLAEKLPAYQTHLRAKLADVRSSGSFKNIRQ